ncbi:cyclodeaminase/cyclohydrolase family protein [Butyrivibrio sp. AE2032]|uniref:cyclodeaminase/cyclohydrolase family protein n=1 Tax=Butyrivibrio sp. AE2032 TaxID=1458463 RepID=UPI0005513E4A|nr:cyclodeaminase/cyclohydrolase family protein [Butyrivibrio sp. AE2032]
MEDRTVSVFLEELSSGAPTPGGGGASAVCGAIAAALGSMVGNLTSGKKKYAEYQEEIEIAIAKCGSLVKEFEALGKKDEEVFEPLAKAYSIPKDQEGRDEILEGVLRQASTAPFEVVEKAYETSLVLARLAVIGSRLAISDVGVAAAACETAAKGAAMNVYINTKSMKDREYAEDLNKKTIDLVNETSGVCSKVYEEVKTLLIGGK